MTDFPLIKSLGLELIDGHRLYPDAPGYTKHVRAVDLEALLASAPVVYGVKDADDVGWCAHHDAEIDTHTALLVNVQPIRKDTAESLLRELIEQCDGETAMIPRHVYDRARALLGKDAP